MVSLMPAQVPQWITFALDWQLALLSLVVVPFLYCSVGYYVKRIQSRIYEVRAMEGEALSIIHEAGTVIMGSDPRKSVLNKYCQAHEVRNLFVMDAAPFVSNPDKNVTLSIVASADSFAASALRSVTSWPSSTSSPAERCAARPASAASRSPATAPAWTWPSAPAATPSPAWP